jgi:hypothetical protein
MRELTRSVHGVSQVVFALVAVLLAVGSASAARKLAAPMLPPLPIDPRAEAMAAQVTTADSLAAAVPLFSNAIWVRPPLSALGLPLGCSSLINVGALGKKNICLRM